MSPAAPAPVREDPRVTAPMRTEFRARERRLEDARAIADGLTVGQLYSLGELEFASVNPAFRGTAFLTPTAETATRQERGFADLFKAALDVIPSGSIWADFASDAGSSVVNSPLDFFASTATGIRDYIEEELKGYADVATGVGSWLADAGACFLQQLPLFGPDSVGGPGSCDGVKKIAQSIETVKRAIVKVHELGFARLIAIGSQVLDLVGRMFSELLHAGLALLGEWKTEVEEWLRRIGKSATELGKLLGTLLGSVLMEWLTAGVGRALKSARLAKNLPARDPFPEGESLRDVPDVQPSLLVEFRVRAAVPSEVLIGRLSNIFQRILAKHGDELNRTFSLAKDRVLRANMPIRPDPPTYKLKRREPAWREFNEQRRHIRTLVRKQIRASYGRIAPHGPNRTFARQTNRNAVTIHQADALTGRNPDAEDILHVEGRKNALLEDFFESNHIVEQRLIRHPDLFRNYADVWKELGWTKIDPVSGKRVPDTDAMTSILMPAAQHTSSLKRMLGRFGFDADEAGKIGKQLPESITTTLQRYIHIGGEGLPPTNPPKWTVLDIDPNNPPPFRKILEKLETIYRNEAPHMWRNPDAPMDLFRQFTEWRFILGYGPIPDIL
jgi:hypothetical protein